MQSCYPHIIDTRYMTTHFLGNQRCLLCHWNVRCASTDHTNEPTCASSHIIRPGNNYCLRVFTDTESVTRKRLTQYLYDPWLDATNNRPSRGRQKASHGARGQCRYTINCALQPGDLQEFTSLLELVGNALSHPGVFQPVIV